MQRIGWTGRMSTLACIAVLACADPATPEAGLPTEARTEPVSAEPPSTAPVLPATATPEPPALPDPGPALPPPPDLSGGAPKRIAARHILIHFRGSMGADPSLRRSRAEAVARAEELLEQLHNGADFGPLALKFSDGPSSGRNGSLGAFGRGKMHEDFEKVAFNLQVDEISGLVETPFGIHIIQRQPLVEVRLGHVLVQWDGLPRASVTRDKDEARAIAEEARRRLMGGEALATVAADLSDGGSGPRGGEIGWFQKGHIQPAFEPVFALPRNGISDLVESVHGFHVLVRLE